MANIIVHDGAHDFRITIKGKFSGICVDEVARSWNAALAQPLSRRYTVDISYLTGYDAAGRKLLRKMHQHGTLFAAATPLSLVFLNEVSAQPRRATPLIPEMAVDSSQNQQPQPNRSASDAPRRAASAK